jgi:hypothetical protein
VGKNFYYQEYGEMVKIGKMPKWVKQGNSAEFGKVSKFRKWAKLVQGQLGNIDRMGKLANLMKFRKMGKLANLMKCRKMGKVGKLDEI